MTTDAVPVLRVVDASVAAAWYSRLGFAIVFEHRFAPGLPLYVGIRREGAQIHLSEHEGDAHPFGLVYLWVDDVDVVAAEFGMQVDDQPWGREVSLVDPDGNRLRIAEPASAPSADEVLGSGATAELIHLERGMWATATRRDPDWMASHLTGSFTEFGMSGRAYDRASILAQPVGPIQATIEGLVVRSMGRDAALVTYRSVQPRGTAHRSSVWVRRDGRWLLEHHQGTEL
jgi:hypothetical protein